MSSEEFRSERLIGPCSVANWAGKSGPIYQRAQFFLLEQQPLRTAGPGSYSTWPRTLQELPGADLTDSSDQLGRTAGQKCETLRRLGLGAVILSLIASMTEIIVC